VPQVRYFIYVRNRSNLLCSVNVLSRTSPSPSASSFDFGTNDLTWFVKESANELQSTSQADNQDDTVVLKNNPTAGHLPADRTVLSASF
jgi:hypothetical protein